MSLVRLSRPLVLETRVDLPDGMGGQTSDWVALGTLWAEIRTGAGGEADGEERALARVTYRITVRAVPPEFGGRPRQGQRFRDGSRLFLIEAVAERDAGGRYLICFAREEGAA